MLMTLNFEVSKFLLHGLCMLPQLYFNLQMNSALEDNASRLLLFLLLLLNHLPFFSRSKTSPFTPARIINHSCHTYLACALLSLKINPCFFFFLYNIPNTFIYKKKVSFFPDIRWIIAHNGAKKVQEKARTQVS